MYRVSIAAIFLVSAAGLNGVRVRAADEAETRVLEQRQAESWLKLRRGQSTLLEGQRNLPPGQGRLLQQQLRREQAEHDTLSTRQLQDQAVHQQRSGTDALRPDARADEAWRQQGYDRERGQQELQFRLERFRRQRSRGGFDP